MFSEADVATHKKSVCTIVIFVDNEKNDAYG